MSNPIEDFIISLGFDTSKVKSQVQSLHKELEKLAVTVDAKRVKQGLTVAKEVGNNEVKVAKEVAKKKEDVEKKSAKKQAEIKEKVQTASEKKRIEAEKQTQKTITETRKQAALRQLRNQIAEYERSTVGPSNLSNRYKYYERGNASLTKIRAFTEEIRGKNTDTRNRMKAEGSLKSFDSASSSKAELDMLKASNAIEVLRVRMQRLGVDTKELDKNLIDAKDVNSLKKLYEQSNTQLKKEIELNKDKAKLDRASSAQQKAAQRESDKQAREANRQARQKAKEAERQAKIAQRLADKQAKEADKNFNKLLKEADRQNKLAEKQASAEAKAKARAAEKQARDAAREADKRARELRKEADRQANLARKEAEKRARLAQQAIDRQERKVRRDAERQQKLAALKPKESSINALMQRYRTNNLMQRGGEDVIMAGAMKQATQKQAEAYVKASLRAMEYSNKGVGNKKDTMRIISEGNVQVLSKANMQLAAMNAKMAAVERRAIGAAAAFNGMHDSARNMVREMASVYALFATTGYIKEQAKAMDGMQAGMVAVSSNAEEAAHNIKFLTDEALKNGLSIKDASKDYVKLKASIGDKLGLAETEEMFQALTKAGVVFQLSQDDMSGTIRAVSQMYSKGKITAKFFGPFSRN